ncbi:SGNH/GDSL hydrolase family protein [Streptomyces fulvoviolaceus]|uniref:SGNH/GDSL hydrolase family protein n=1 Tax=Streptomyces fulvoviolaceus TaxID=285535 RepID=UPI0004C5EE0E|nr:SGNH/GDSL hydrolase family protein [Streptomyces fulvoviolaceus]
MTTHTRVMLAGLLVACGTLAAAVGVTRYDGDDAPASSKWSYVALGDSYTAGPKIPDQDGDPAGCDRSDRNYPSLVAARLQLNGADFKDVSCNGATIADLTTAQSTDDGTNPAQLTALSHETRLVTVGIGGNDIGFASTIKQCVAMGALYELAAGHAPEDAPCARRYGDDVQEKTEVAGKRLSRALGEIRRRAPEARVYVVGYPSILPADGAECSDEMTVAPGDVTFLREQEQQLNTELRERAKAAGVGYVDTYKPSEGRDACSAEGARWIEPLLPKSPAAAMHPNELGERGMADAVLRAMRSSL